jgi:hypothetical protein
MFFSKSSNVAARVPLGPSASLEEEDFSVEEEDSSTLEEESSSPRSTLEELSSLPQAASIKEIAKAEEITAEHALKFIKTSFSA